MGRGQARVGNGEQPGPHIEGRANRSVLRQQQGCRRARVRFGYDPCLYAIGQGTGRKQPQRPVQAVFDRNGSGWLLFWEEKRGPSNEPLGLGLCCPYGQNWVDDGGCHPHSYHTPAAIVLPIPERGSLHRFFRDRPWQPAAQSLEGLDALYLLTVNQPHLVTSGQCVLP